MESVTSSPKMDISVHKTKTSGHKVSPRAEVQFRTSPELWDRKTKQAMKSKKKSLRLEKYPDLRSRFVDPLAIEQVKILDDTVKHLMEPGKGIMAVDDSIRQIENRLKTMGLEPKEDNRRRYLETLLSPGHLLNRHLSGVIFRENVIDQKGYMGKRIVAMVKESGLKLGIRVDKGVLKIPGTLGEWATDGLDTYEDTCTRIKSLGAEFVMWRCVYTTAELDTPSNLALQINSNTLARFASVSQRMGLVPIVAVEVLWAPGVGPSDSEFILRQVLAHLFAALQCHQVYMEGVILRIPAIYSPHEKSQLIGEVTLITLNKTLPPAFGGVVLASQQNLSNSLELLDALNKTPVKKPTLIGFCFSNVIQEGLEDIWSGNDKNVVKVNDELVKRIKLCSIASMGQCPEVNRSVFVNNITVL